MEIEAPPSETGLAAVDREPCQGRAGSPSDRDAMDVSDGAPAPAAATEAAPAAAAAMDVDADQKDAMDTDQKDVLCTVVTVPGMLKIRCSSATEATAGARAVQRDDADAIQGKHVLPQSRGILPHRNEPNGRR